MRAEDPLLIVLPPSHYCERARWALAFTGIPFREVGWAVGLHIPLARRIAPGTSLPILKIAAEVIQGSGPIVDWTGMAGGDPALEARFESRIGALVRRYVYSKTLASEGARMRGLLLDGVPAWQRVAGTAMWPGTRKLMIKAMKIDPDQAPRMEDEIERELDWLEARLEGRRHLVDDQFGRADLTAASLLSPLAGALQLSAAKRAGAIGFPRFQERPAIAWVRAIYRDYRDAVGPVHPLAPRP